MKATQEHTSETEGALTCGCRVRLMREQPEDDDGTRAAIVVRCPLHKAAPELLGALRRILENAGFTNGEAEPSLRELTVNIDALQWAREAIAKAETLYPRG